MKYRIIWFALLISLLFGCERPSSAPRSEGVGLFEKTVIAGGATNSDRDTNPPQEIEGEAVREAYLLAHLLPEARCKEEPLATYFFTLMGRNSVDNCGRRNPRVIAAFDALLAEEKIEGMSDGTAPSLSDRLLSGPSAPGRPVLLHGETWWYYTACQAHECNTSYLAMLYEPVKSKMVGRLVARCQIWWLGDPSSEQQVFINTIDPVEAKCQGDAAVSGVKP